jgi:hypothetical protein
MPRGVDFESTGALAWESIDQGRVAEPLVSIGQFELCPTNVLREDQRDVAVVDAKEDARSLDLYVSIRDPDRDIASI